MTIAYAVDALFADHQPPSPHPERPERLTAVAAALRESGVASTGLQVPTRKASDDELLAVHTEEYVHQLQKTLPGASGWLDEDTYYSPSTWTACLCAAAAAVDVSASVFRGGAEAGVAFVRPPGHHAEPDRAMGFCILNNIAIAAAALREQGARVAIVDWDVHHGNGTQRIFEADANVLFVSIHQFPFFPGTGSASETGVGPGRGFTVNVPLAAGAGDADYLAIFDSIVSEELLRFGPDILLVSAGFDAHTADPLGGMRLSRAGFFAMAARLRNIARRCSGGRLAAVLEGGYDMVGLQEGVESLLEALGGRQPEPNNLEPRASTVQTIEVVRGELRVAREVAAR